MKVVFDISVLGIGHFNPRARTGIARAIESLSAALQQRADLELRYSACSSLENYVKTKIYLSHQNSLDPKRLAVPPQDSGQRICAWYEKVFRARPGALSSASPLCKFSGRLQKTLQLNTRFWSKVLNLADIADEDIFHTPFFAFPKITDRATRLRRFLTVYDLIPLLYPEYFRFNETRNLKATLAKVTRKDFVLAISQSTKNDLCDRFNIDPTHVFVTPLAASRFFVPCSDSRLVVDTSSRYNIPNSPYILSLCTFEPRKNIEQTIRSFCSLVRQQQISDLNLVLVGAKGWKFDRIFDEIREAANLTHRIIVTGYVSDEDLSAIYSRALMFAYPSFYEGFGLPPLEAMQCGVPVITSNTSSLPEVVGNAGIMVDPTDGDALSQAMSDLYNSTDLRSTLSMKGIERAKTFSWERCAAETVLAYQAAMSLS